MNSLSLAPEPDIGASRSAASGADVDEIFHLPIADDAWTDCSFSILLTRLSETRGEALELINRRYAWRGYGSDHRLSGRHNETTFCARKCDQLIGTVTLCADSDRGLAVEATFPEEMKFFRRKPNARLCELKKFAVDYNDDSKRILAAMFHFVFIYGTENFLGTDLFIEVNPRHIMFYERMLGFQKVGGLKTNTSVNAPSQLMWLSVERIPELIAAGNNRRNRHSLYNYFYNADQEGWIIDEMRLRGLAAYRLAAAE